MSRTVLGTVFALLLIGVGSASADTPRDAEVRCLAQNIYWETRAVDRRDALAVSHVVLNRVADERFPDTVCDVVAQRHRGVCQFTWWCAARGARPRELDSWQTSMELAREVLSRRTADPTRGALFYHSARISRPWTVPRQRVGRIGNHVFYR